MVACNNISIHLPQIPVFHAQTKHIEMHYHFIWEHVLVGYVNLQHINTNLQMTDIFTKALGANKLRQFMANLGFSTTNQSILRGNEDSSPDTEWP